MMSKLRISLNRRHGCLGLETPHSSSMEKVSPNGRTKGRARMDSLRTTGLSHKQRRTMGRQRKTLGSGASSIRSPNIKPLNVSQSSHWWSRYNPIDQMWDQTLNRNPKKGDESLMQNPVPSLAPPRSSPVNLVNQRKVSTPFIHRCGWRVLHCTSSLIVVGRRTSSQ